jgi:hypothetical protein
MLCVIMLNVAMVNVAVPVEWIKGDVRCLRNKQFFYLADAAAKKLECLSLERFLRFSRMARSLPLERVGSSFTLKH